MSRKELLALAERIRDRDADMKRRGGKIQRVFSSEVPLVIVALEKAAGDDSALSDHSTEPEEKR